MKVIKKSIVYMVLLLCVTAAVSEAKSNAGFYMDFSDTYEATPADSGDYQIISRGKAAGEYQAFPDACRLKNGDILVVYYAGDGHVTFPNKAYPKAGRICMVRSKDEGKTWSKPVVIYDDAYDNRDPHISQLNDGTVMLTFFSLILESDPQKRTPGGLYILKSEDDGNTWDTEPQMVSPEGENWYCSAPVREMSDGTLVFPVYYQGEGRKAWGGVFLSYNRGTSWGNVIPIGKEADLFLAAETDVIRLNDGALLAALRGQYEVPMHYALSHDVGKNWSAAKNIGFLGHSPSFTRLTTGEILLSYRGISGGKGFSWENAYTALRISYDDGKTWQGPYLMSKSGGAYPATIELKDHSILMIFYEEGEGSGIGAFRFEKPENDYGAPVPTPIKTLPYTK